MASLSYMLLAVFALLAVAHLVMAYLRIVKRRPGYSAVPLVNGLLGVTALALSPSETLSSLWWLAVVVDWGCVPLAIEMLLAHARSERR